MSSKPQRRRPAALGLALVLAVVPLSAPMAAGLKPGTTVYIKTRNTQWRDSASPMAKTLDTLQPGTAVEYRGADKDPRWHVVLYGGRTGVVFRSNLSLTPVKTESLGVSKGASSDITAYASRGAATKALGDGAVAYAKEKDPKWGEEAARRLAALEAVSRELDKHVAARAKKAGLPEVVGPEPKVAHGSTR
ncbi:MAG TPA: SH3 domain-containing protein [Myxococcaceae bacterium]|nr:SH3 domain-containing protein [Myxococcaceae bacterium]